MRIFWLVFFCLVMQLQSQSLPKQVTLSRQDAVDLVNQLLKACEPDRPENVYFPSLIKEKVRWIYNEAAAKRLTTSFTEDQDKKIGNQVRMTSGYIIGGKPFLEINANHLMLSIRIRDGVKIGFNRKQKNTFALTLTHEAVHLERPRSFFESLKTRQAVIDEELRTYRKVDRLAVAELLKKGEPLDVDLHEMHEVLTKCSSSVTCASFTDYYIRNRNNPLLPKR